MEGTPFARERVAASASEVRHRERNAQTPLGPSSAVCQLAVRLLERCLYSGVLCLLASRESGLCVPHALDSSQLSGFARGAFQVASRALVAVQCRQLSSQALTTFLQHARIHLQWVEAVAPYACSSSVHVAARSEEARWSRWCCLRPAFKISVM